MPKLITSDKENKKMRWDAKRKTWVGWQIDVYVSRGIGKKPKRHRPVYPSESAAKDAESRFRVRSENIKRGIEKPDEDAAPVTLRAALERHLESMENEKNKKDAKRNFERFLELLPEDIHVTELTTAELALYAETRSKELTPSKTQVKPGSINRELADISNALHLAPERFKELRSWACPRIPRARAPKTRRERVFSDQEIDALLARLNRPRDEAEKPKKYRERLLTALEMEFALLTSSRRKEVVKLKWSDYFPDQNILLITRWKTIKTKADSVTVFSPVPERVKEILKLRKKDSQEYVFGSGEENYYRYIRDLKEACKHLKIPYGRFTDGGLILHDARHTFVSNLIKNKIDLETVRELAGLSREMVLRYAHSSPAQKKEAVEVIDKKRRNLREIYDKVKNNEMEFEEFETLFSG